MTRDMTRKQFRDALKRNGFRLDVLWLTDTTGACPDVTSGLILTRSGKICRRESLAKAIQKRERGEPR